MGTKRFSVDVSFFVQSAGTVNDREAGMGQVKVQHSADGRTDARTNGHKRNVWAEKIVKHSWVTQATPIQQLDNVCDGWKLLECTLRQ